MKTVSNNTVIKSFEFAKRILYSFEVLIIGIFIPFLFLIGTNTTLGGTYRREKNISKPHETNSAIISADKTIFLSDQHS